MAMAGRSRYDNDMSTPQGAAVAPYQPGVISGEVVQPTRMISPRTAAVHALGVVLKSIITAHPFKSEGDKLEALSVVDKFAQAFADQPVTHAVREDHPAPVEDVSLRKPPPGTPAPPPAPGPQIDYAQLAAALVAAQRAQAEAEAEPVQVHSITDAPATASPAA